MPEERFLNPEEVELLLNLSVSTDETWEMLLATPDDSFFQAVADLFSNDSQVRIVRALTGCEALIVCARSVPDLLVLDSRLTDIQAERIIGAVRADSGFRDLAVLCRLDKPGDTYPDWGADGYLVDGEDLDRVYLSRKLRSRFAAGKGIPGSSRQSVHERRWPRARLNLRARLDIVKPGESEASATGEATIENISLGGAYLTNIRLPEGGSPGDMTSLVLKIDTPTLRNWNADSMVVRVQPDGAAGIRFTDLDPEARAKLLRFFG